MELETSPQEASALVEGGEVELVDVRRPDEWQQGHIPGARHIPLDELAARAAELDEQQPVVFYCAVGERSLVAAEAFAASGRTATSIAGGIGAWQDAGLPVET
jgi:rhodanese-related sulfurtransferase